MACAAAAPSNPFDVAVYRLDPNDAQAPSQTQPAPDDGTWIEPLLQQNAVWFCHLRWCVIAVLACAGVAGLFPKALAPLGLAISPQWPSCAAVLLAVLNLGFIQRLRGAHTRPGSTRVRRVLWAQIITDLLVLTAVIHWLGHEVISAPFMYLFHIILACIAFPPLESLCVVALAAAFYMGSLACESLGILPANSVLVHDPAPPAFATGGPSVVSVLSMLLVWSVIWYLVSRLAEAVRSRDHELFISNRRLRASIDERSQHMLQTTHQLKAPFAAIHAQSQLLLGEYCGALPPQARAAVEKISARCLVLARQIQEMLQLANLRSQGQMPPPRRRVNLGALLEDLITRVEPAARQRGVRFEKEIEPVTVDAVEDHLTMLMDNLLVNAVNYSYENGIVQVSCHGRKRGETVVVVRDSGIGIPREKLPRIFDDYYRTEEAVQHNRGSTGLGLAIVRQVACKDRMPITVESAPGWGTRFTVTLPGVSAPLSSPAPNLNN